MPLCLRARATIRLFMLALNSPRFSAAVDRSSASWACVRIPHGRTEATVFDAELLPTNVTVINVSRSYGGSYLPVTKRTRVYILRRLLAWRRRSLRYAITFVRIRRTTRLEMLYATLTMAISTFGNRFPSLAISTLTLAPSLGSKSARAKCSQNNHGQVTSAACRSNNSKQITFAWHTKNDAPHLRSLWWYVVTSMHTTVLQKNQHLSNLFFFFRGRRQGRQPLNIPWITMVYPIFRHTHIPHILRAVVGKLSSGSWHPPAFSCTVAVGPPGHSPLGKPWITYLPNESKWRYR